MHTLIRTSLVHTSDAQPRCTPPMHTPMHTPTHTPMQRQSLLKVNIGARPYHILVQYGPLPPIFPAGILGVASRIPPPHQLVDARVRRLAMQRRKCTVAFHPEERL